MKRLAFFWFFLVALTCAQVSAQIPVPTPTPDPHVYSDPAMSFTAPADAFLVQRSALALSELSEDLQPVALWVVHAGKEDTRTIQIEMESYNGPPQEWEGQFESQTHGSQEGTLIRNKTAISLLNGMPAYFVEVAYGSGFDARKEYAVVWADGQRGIVLSETTRMGDTTSEAAQAALKQVTATRYPFSQP